MMAAKKKAAKKAPKVAADKIACGLQIEVAKLRADNSRLQVNAEHIRRTLALADNASHATVHNLILDLIGSKRERDAFNHTAEKRALQSALSENAALLANLTATQQRCGELLELTRERDVDAHVRQLFRGYKQDVPETPCVSDDETMRLRLSLIVEEFEELLASCLGKPSPRDHDAWTQWNYGAGREYAQHGPLRVNLPELVDACIDLIVVTIGMLVACGVRFWPMWWAVHRSNVAKFGGPRREDGKQMKPANWQPPRIDVKLREQGWQG